MNQFSCLHFKDEENKAHDAGQSTVRRLVWIDFVSILWKTSKSSLEWHLTHYTASFLHLVESSGIGLILEIILTLMFGEISGLVREGNAGVTSKQY